MTVRILGSAHLRGLCDRGLLCTLRVSVAPDRCARIRQPMTCAGARLAAGLRPGPCPPGLRVHRARRAGRPLDAQRNLSDRGQRRGRGCLSVFMGDGTV